MILRQNKDVTTLVSFIWKVISIAYIISNINGMDMKKHILIVDDEEYLLTTLQRSLNSLNKFQVTTTTNVHQVLNIIGELNIDVLITDLSMPGRAGLDLVADTRNKYPGMKIITISGRGPI